MILLQSKYHLINSINKINKNRGFEEIDFRFYFILESLFTHSRQVSNDFINWCYGTEDEIELNREALKAFIEQYKTKKPELLKAFIDEIFAKADRKRVDNRRKQQNEELSGFDLHLTELQYLAGYRGSKGYIKKEFVTLLKSLHDENPAFLDAYKAFCIANEDKPEITHFIKWKNIFII